MIYGRICRTNTCLTGGSIYCRMYNATGRTMPLSIVGDTYLQINDMDVHVGWTMIQCTIFATNCISFPTRSNNCTNDSYNTSSTVKSVRFLCDVLVVVARIVGTAAVSWMEVGSIPDCRNSSSNVDISCNIVSCSVCNVSFFRRIRSTSRSISAALSGSSAII